MYVTLVGPAAVSGWVTRTASPRGPRFFEAITVSFCEDEEHGEVEPLQALEKPVQVLLEGLVTSENFKDVINGFKEFVDQNPGVSDKVVVCTLRTALGCEETQRKMIAHLLLRLWEEQVLDQTSFIRGYATLICSSWQEDELFVAEMLLTCIRCGCIAGQFLSRLPEGFLTAGATRGACWSR